MISKFIVITRLDRTTFYSFFPNPFNTISCCPAQRKRSCFCIPATIKSGNISGVQAKTGTPSALNLAAFSWSYDGLPSSLSASKQMACTPDSTIFLIITCISLTLPPSYRSVMSTSMVSSGLVMTSWQKDNARLISVPPPSCTPNRISTGSFRSSVRSATWASNHPSILIYHY